VLAACNVYIKQIYIAPHQEALLKRKARALGPAEAELVF